MKYVLNSKTSNNKVVNNSAFIKIIGGNNQQILSDKSKYLS
jgi:hypothetical protein